MFTPQQEISIPQQREADPYIVHDVVPLSLGNGPVGVVSDMHAFELERIGSNFRWPTIDVLLDKFIDQQKLSTLIINGDFIDNSIQPDVRRTLEQGNWHNLLSRLKERLVDPEHSLEKLIFTIGNHDPEEYLIEIKKFMVSMAEGKPYRGDYLKKNIVLTKEVNLSEFYPKNLNTGGKHVISIEHGHERAKPPVGDTVFDEKIEALEDAGKKVHAEALRRWKSAWLRRVCGLVLNIYAGTAVNKQRPIFRHYSHLLASDNALYDDFIAKRDGHIAGGFGHTHKGMLRVIRSSDETPDLLLFNSGLWGNSVIDSDMFGIVINQDSIKLQKYNIKRNGNVECDEIKSL